MDIPKQGIKSKKGIYTSTQTQDAYSVPTSVGEAKVLRPHHNIEASRYEPFEKQSGFSMQTITPVHAARLHSCTVYTILPPFFFFGNLSLADRLNTATHSPPSVTYKKSREMEGPRLQVQEPRSAGIKRHMYASPSWAFPFLKGAQNTVQPRGPTRPW